MFKKIVALNGREHLHIKLKSVDHYRFVAKEHVVSLMVSEFVRAGSIFPIVFVKQQDGYTASALLGIQQGENLFVGADGRWNASYIPMIIRRYPFILGKNAGGANPDEMMVCIDAESAFLSEHEGTPLFDGSGQPSKIIEEAKQYLTGLHAANEMTVQFCREMDQRGLLTPINMQIRGMDGISRNIEGCFGINETKLNALADWEFMELRKRGALPMMYAQMHSVAQLERLLQLKQKVNQS